MHLEKVQSLLLGSSMQCYFFMAFFYYIYMTAHTLASRRNLWFSRATFPWFSLYATLATIFSHIPVTLCILLMQAFHEEHKFCLSLNYSVLTLYTHCGLFLVPMHVVICKRKAACLTFLLCFSAAQPSVAARTGGPGPLWVSA